MSVSEALQVTSLKGWAVQIQHLATIDIYDILVSSFSWQNKINQRV